MQRGGPACPRKIQHLLTLNTWKCTAVNHCTTLCMSPLNSLPQPYNHYQVPTASTTSECTTEEQHKAGHLGHKEVLAIARQVLCNDQELHFASRWGQISELDGQLHNMLLLHHITSHSLLTSSPDILLSLYPQHQEAANKTTQFRSHDHHVTTTM